MSSPTRVGTAMCRPTAGKPSRSSGLTRAIRRPAVTSSLLLAVIATTAAGYQAADQRQTGAAAFTVSTEAIAQANELADAQIEDTARLAADRNDTNASIAAAQEKDRSRRGRRRRGRRQGPPRGRREGRPRQGAQGPRGQEAGAPRERPEGPPRRRPGAARRVRLRRQPVVAASTTCGWARAAGATPPRTPRPAPTASRSPCPASKMATVGADYRTNPVTQIRWGLQYIKSSYGTPCGAWSAWQSRSPHWY